MKKYILAALFCGTFTFCSCSGFLDEVPKGQITTESYYRTEQHAISATNAIYNYLIMGYSPGGLWDKNYGGVFYNDYWVLQDLFSDNANSQQASIQYTSVDNMQIDQYNEPVELLWRDFYQTIKCCNVVIDKVPAIDMDDILKKHLIAEAKFFRGMMYFDLIRMFGDVPLREHNLESADEGSMVRVSKDEIYKLIFEDLITAETDLKYSPRYGGGRPYPESASALLARVYLTYAAEHNDTEYYELAVKKADAVIPKFPMLENYADLFKISNRFNSEIIWGANFSASLSDGWADPFIVCTEQLQTRVLGTVFDMKAYPRYSPDVILYQGRVNVSHTKRNQSKEMHPGEQISLDKQGKLQLKRVDTEKRKGWAENEFSFDNTDLRQVMQDIGSWYNISIAFRSRPLLDERIYFHINRQLPVNTVLDALNDLKIAQFTMKEGKIIVEPPQDKKR